jgi:hypothetical protein
MTREEILIKALAIAKRNGFDISDDIFVETPTEVWVREGQDLYFSLIFDHNFAKCFFLDDFVSFDGFDKDSENVVLSDCENPMTGLLVNRDNISIPLWEYHLIQMVLSKDPLNYLYEFILEYEQSRLN